MSISHALIDHLSFSIDLSERLLLLCQSAEADLNNTLLKPSSTIVGKSSQAMLLPAFTQKLAKTIFDVTSKLQTRP